MLTDRSRRPRKGPYRTAVCIAIAVAVGACAGAESHSGDTVVRDSAGIAIVENSAPDENSAPVWRLATEPTLSIGVLEGDPDYQLFRVVGAVRLSDGRVVVANSGTHELRFYGPDGAYLLAVGGEGSGPGEFTQLGMVRHYMGDSLLAYDWSNRRVSIFDHEGEFARSFILQSPEENVFAHLVGPIGPELLSNLQSPIGPDEVRDGVREDSTTAIRVTPDGGLVDTVQRFPGYQRYIKSRGRSGYMALTLPFGLGPRFALAADRFCFGRGESYEIRCYDPDGSLTRVVRLDRPNLPVTPEDVERDRERQLDNAFDDTWRERLREVLPDIPYPERMPAYRRIIFDAAGRLWVERYPRPGDEETTWSVFDDAGMLITELELPSSFAPSQIDDDAILGLHRDEIEIERVQLYPLIRS